MLAVRASSTSPMRNGESNAVCIRSASAMPPPGVAVAGQDDELVPAEPADDVVSAGAGAESGGDVAQQLVAHLVAQGVVDGLEAVEVHEQHGDGASPRPLQRLRDELVQVGAVGQ